MATATRATFVTPALTKCCVKQRPSIFVTPESSRNPYPFPQLENDDTFRGREYNWRQTPTLKTWQYQTIDPWFRINRWHTLSSYRHEVCRDEPTAPRDSLDIILKAEYDHHHEWLKSKAELLLQRDTLNKPHNRLLRNRIYREPVPKPELGHPLRVTICPKKEHPSSIEKSILGHHNQLTNPGYSRKREDGTMFFS